MMEKAEVIDRLTEYSGDYLISSLDPENGYMMAFMALWGFHKINLYEEYKKKELLEIKKQVIKNIEKRNNG